MTKNRITRVSPPPNWGEGEGGGRPSATAPNLPSSAPKAQGLRANLLPNWGEGDATISDTLKYITEYLRDFSDAPSVDAQRIILHVLKKKEVSYLLAHDDEILSDKNLKTILNMAEQRKKGMPLAYVVGETDFYGRTFTVTPDVLIPRPDTELLIDTTLEYIQNNFDTKKELIIADICTGSGIIAISLALELPLAHIIATDISPAALEIAKQNAKQHSVADRIEFLESDLLDPIKNRKIDLIVSNPPYVPSKELAKAGSALKTRGLLFEPQIALDGGEDGLTFVNQIKEFSKQNNIPAIIETVGGEIITVFNN